MKCGNCSFTDGLCYTSNPPKVKCTITGEFHGYGDTCNVPTATLPPRPTIAVPCLICGESKEMYEYLGPIVCEKCKEAVMKVRADLEKEREAELNRLKSELIQYKLTKKALDIMDNHSKTL